MCTDTGASKSCIASGRLLPGGSCPLPARWGDARCLQFRCPPAAGTSAGPASALAPGSNGKPTIGGNGGSPSIANGQLSGSHYDGGWSAPLAMGRRQVAGGSWRMLAAAATLAAAALPVPGESCLVPIPSNRQHSEAQAAVATPTGEDSSSGANQQLGQLISVTLAAEQALEAGPALALTLLPHGVLHNCTGRDLALEDPQGGAWSATAAAGTEAVISTGSPRAPPSEVSTSACHERIL